MKRSAVPVITPEMIDAGASEYGARRHDHPYENTSEIAEAVYIAMWRARPRAKRRKVGGAHNETLEDSARRALRKYPDAGRRLLAVSRVVLGPQRSAPLLSSLVRRHARKARLITD